MIAVSGKISKAMGVSQERHQEKRQKPNRLFDQAVEVFEANPSWSSGKRINVLDGWLRGKPGKVFLKNHQGVIKLFVDVAGRTRWISPGFLIGMCYPLDGWKLSIDATLANFNTWHKRQTAEIARLENRGRL